MKLQGMTLRRIASALGRSPSTLSRELARNCSGEAYVCRDAQARCETRRAKARPAAKLDPASVAAGHALAGMAVVAAENRADTAHHVARQT
jgi:IS30 family transposase